MGHLVGLGFQAAEEMTPPPPAAQKLIRDRASAAVKGLLRRATQLTSESAHEGKSKEPAAHQKRTNRLWRTLSSGPAIRVGTRAPVYSDVRTRIEREGRASYGCARQNR